MSLLGAITLLPIGWQLNRFVVWVYYQGLHIYAWPRNEWITLGLLAHALNVLLTVPLGLLARLGLPRLPWWTIPLGVLVLSASIELAQWLLPLGREGTVADVLTNTLGGLVGALLGQWWLSRHAQGADPLTVTEHSSD
ncbi:VanZ family protein [Aestuariimicrobium sp. Y1814]|uniref:VanZ family protein n=1 Tax=Aestuariimicrobium sp. Y1814 TaxID=3418742 RepID=UPI003DA76A60